MMIVNIKVYKKVSLMVIVNIKVYKRIHDHVTCE